STLELSRMPARIRASTYSRDRVSTTTDSIPSWASRWDSSRPAGPAPTIATSVRMRSILQAGGAQRDVDPALRQSGGRVGGAGQDPRHAVVREPAVPAEHHRVTGGQGDIRVRLAAPVRGA